MHKQEDHDIRDMGAARIESIEDLLRSRGFFDSGEREKKEEEVLVG